MATTTGEVTEVSVKPAPEREGWFKRQIKLHAYIGETVFLVGIFGVLNMGLMPANPGFYGIEPNPLFAVILLMAARYGFRAGLLAAALSAGLYYALVAARVGVVASRDLLLWRYAKPAVLFLVSGLIVGMLVERHRDRIKKLGQERDLLARDNQALKRGEEELRDVNVELANRVVGASDTLPMLYKYAKKLNSLNIDDIYTALTEMVMEVIKAHQVSVYVAEGTHLKLHSRNGQRESDGELRLDPEVFGSIINKRKVVTLHDLLARNIRRKDLYLAGPLGAGAGRVAAVLAVEDLEFLRYNPGTVRLFNVVVDWAADCLEQAGKYKDKPEELRRQQNKHTLLRAQRATMAPGSLTGAQVISASRTQAVAGAIADADAVPRAPAAVATGSGLPSIIAAGGARGGLGDLMSAAQEHLFGDTAVRAGVAAGGKPLDLDVEDPEQLVIDEPQDRRALQHMLSGELQIADAQGNKALTRLLAEIDGFLSSKGGA